MLKPRNFFLIICWLCFDCNSVFMIKQAIFYFSLCFLFFIANLTLANAGIKCSDIHVLKNLMSACTFNNFD